MTLVQLTPLIAVAMTAASALVRRFSPTGGWMHSTGGALLLAFVSGLLGALGGAWQAHGISWAVTLPAVCSVIGSLSGTYNPTLAAANASSGTSAADALKAVNKQSGRASLVVLAVVAALGFCVAVANAGCAPGTDGLRQSCANANVTLASATVTGTAIYKFGHQDLRAHLTKENADATEQKAKAYDAAFDKFIATMTSAASTKKVLCDSADAYDAGAKRDLVATVMQVVKLVEDVASAVADLRKAIDEFKPTAKRLFLQAVA